MSIRYRAVRSVSSNPRDAEPGVDRSWTPLANVTGRTNAIDSVGVSAFFLVEHLRGRENRGREYRRRLRTEHRFMVRGDWDAHETEKATKLEANHKYRVSMAFLTQTADFLQERKQERLQEGAAADR